MKAQFNLAIDTVRDAQTKVIGSTVLDDSFQKPLKTMVSAGADLTKATVNAFFDATQKHFSYAK